MDRIARIRQEIERRINILTNVYDELMERKDEEMMTYYHGKVIALEELCPFLDTLSEEPDRPEPYTGKYDEAYLDEKIKKATEHWKGVDVDKMLAECRGYDEQPDKSLEEAARLEEEIAKYFSGWKNDSEYGQAIIVETSQCVSVEDCKDIARYFYQLGIYPKMPKDFVAARDYANYKESHSLNAYIAFDEGFTKGVKWDQEQMLKGAEEVTVLGHLLGSPMVCCIANGCSDGDKVRILVLKEEEE